MSLSQSSTNPNAVDTNPGPRRRGVNKDYSKIIKTLTYKEAKQYMVDSLSNYNKLCTRKSEEGDKVYYYCTRNKKCPKVVYILLVIIFLSLSL